MRHLVIKWILPGMVIAAVIALLISIAFNRAEKFSIPLTALILITALMRERLEKFTSDKAKHEPPQF